jgi:hypothetical protein
MRPVRELRITIAGVTIAMISREADLEFAVEEPILRFMNQQATPDITLHVAWDSTTTNGGGEKMFDSGGVWQLFRQHDLLVFHLTAPKFGTRPYTRAALNPDFATGVVYLRRECVDRDRPLYPLEYPLDELLITNWLALGRGVEVHACAVVDADGSGYLFAGYSGAGKSTMARLWCAEQQASVLSDDRVILTKVHDEVWMHGTPWHGDEPLASPNRARLHRGFFLQHAPAHAMTRVAGAQAVMELFARSFPPFFSASGLDFTLSLLTEIDQVVPFFKLGFVPDRAVPDFIRKS